MPFTVLNYSSARPKILRHLLSELYSVYVYIAFWKCCATFTGCLQVWFCIYLVFGFLRWCGLFVHSMDNGLLFHMTQLANRSTIRSHCT